MAPWGWLSALMGTAAYAQGWPSSLEKEVTDRPDRAACTSERWAPVASLSWSRSEEAMTVPAGSMMATSSPVRDWYWAMMAVRSASRPCSTSSLATAARPLASRAAWPAVRPCSCRAASTAMGISSRTRISKARPR